MSLFVRFFTLLCITVFNGVVICTNNTVPANANDLTLDQKIGQLIIAAAVSNPDHNIQLMEQSPYAMHPDTVHSLISQYAIGGVIFLGTGFMNEQFATTKEFQSLAHIPLLVCQDLEWGNMRLEDGFPSPITALLGSFSDDIIEQTGYTIGMQCKALGVHCNLAPVADVNTNPANPVINDRSFGSDPLQVAHKAALFAHGLQRAGILACAKHFPGHGDTAVDSHYDLPIINHTRKRLEDIELYPFKHLINEGIKTVMIGHLAVPALEPDPHLPATFSHAIVTNLLRNTYKFQGLIFTDGLGMQALTRIYDAGTIAVKALQAGADILLCPTDIPVTIAAIKEALDKGSLDQRDIDQKVERILKAKREFIT